MQKSSLASRLLTAAATAIPVYILFITLISIPLASAGQMGLTNAQTSSWLFATYGVSAVLSLILTLRYRQPFLVTGSIFVLIFVASLGDQIPYAELVGASILAGIVVAIITILGVMRWIAALIPEPIVLGLLSGAILPLVTGVFTALEDMPVVISLTIVAYILGRWLLKNRLPAILPAVIVAILATILTGQVGQPAIALALPQLTLTMPVFSLSTIASITPVFVVLITLQSNVPSMIFMSGQGFEPPARLVNTGSGIATALTSLLGPTGISLSLPLTAIVAGPNAGVKESRYYAIFFTAGVGLTIALLAGIAVALPDFIPLPVLNALAGLSMFDVLLHALTSALKSPVKVGPLFTFVIAVSQVTFLGFGAFFWALVGGTLITLLIEREELQQWREHNYAKN